MMKILPADEEEGFSTVAADWFAIHSVASFKKLRSKRMKKYACRAHVFEVSKDGYK